MPMKEQINICHKRSQPRRPSQLVRNVTALMTAPSAAPPKAHIIGAPDPLKLALTKMFGIYSTKNNNNNKAALSMKRFLKFFWSFLFSSESLWVAVMEPREGDFFFFKGSNEVHKGGFISQISDISPTQFTVFRSIKALIIPLT